MAKASRSNCVGCSPSSWATFPHKSLICLDEVAKAFLVTAATVASWLRRVDEQGPKALLQLRTPVNRFPDFVRYVVTRQWGDLLAVLVCGHARAFLCRRRLGGLGCGLRTIRVLPHLHIALAGVRDLRGPGEDVAGDHGAAHGFAQRAGRAQAVPP